MFFGTKFQHIQPPLLVLLLLFSPLHLLAQDDGTQSENDAGQTVEPGEDEDRRVRRLGDSSAEEWEMDLSMPSGPADGAQQTEYDLPDPEQNDQLQSLLSALAVNPGNSELIADLDNFLGEILQQAQGLVDQGQNKEAQQLLSVVRNVNPQKEGLSDALQFLEDLRNVDTWLLAASQAMDDDQILEPADGSALHFLDRILAVDPDNQMARGGLQRAQRLLIDRALVAAQELDFELAEEWLYEASLTREPQDLVEEAHEQVAKYQARQVDKIEQDVINAIDAGDFNLAEFVMIDLIALLGNNEKVQDLRTRLNAAKRYGQYSPGEIIQDGLSGSDGTAPAVVVVKAGSFLMGSPEREKDRSDNEGPQHRVTLNRGFAMGMHEVSVSQFRKFVEASRFRTQAETIGSSKVYDEKLARIVSRDKVNWKHDFQGKPARDNDPVLHIDWYDAQAYVSWLSVQTGQQYRLPTEAEFEYSIRSGSVTRYWWGDDRPEQPIENLTGTQDESESGRRWTAGFKRYEDGFWGPAPVSSFTANSLGLYDMAGNVSEWVEDCWHQTYTLGPVDGSAWVNPGCDRRVVRGGYWASAKDQARSAARISAGANLHGPRVGIRVARDL